MSNDTSYDLVFCHREKKYLLRVMEHLLDKKSRYEKRPKNIPLDEQLRKLGLSSRADFVSWGFEFGTIESGRFLTQRLGFIDGYGVTATAWANENSSNVHISGEDGELASLLRTFPELDVSGSYSDEYSTGSIRGHEKVQEQSREEADAEEAEWGGDDYSEATKTLLNKTYHGPFSLQEARKLIAQGADLNASMNGTPFGGMLADPGWELYKAIPEFLEKGMEMRTIGYLHADLARVLAQKYFHFELHGLFHLEPDVAKILVDEVSKRSKPKDGKEWRPEPGSNWFWRNLLEEGPHLSLRLPEVPDDLARILIQFPGKLNFPNLREIPKSLARILAQHVGPLSLGLSHELDEELASILSAHHGILDLGDLGAWSEGVVELSEKAASEIGKHKGPLCFTGLRALSSEAAAGLAKNTYGLHFQDLGWWNSTGSDLNELKDNHGNSYRFDLPDETLSQLMQCPGEIYIGVDHLNERQAEIIAANTGYCWMDHYRTSLQPEIARILAKKKGGLGLNGITELSDEACEILSVFKGSLNLEGLEKVSPKGLRFLKVIWDAPEPAMLGCPLVEELAQGKTPPLQQQPTSSAKATALPQADEKEVDEKSRLSALLKEQLGANQQGSSPVAPAVKIAEPLGITPESPKGNETRQKSTPQDEPITRESLFDVERLREELRKEIKAEVLREIRSEPKTAPPSTASHDVSPTGFSTNATPMSVAQKDLEPNLSPYRRPHGIRKFSWLIFPLGLLLGWILMVIFPRITPYTSTVPINPPDQVAVTQKDPQPTQATAMPPPTIEPRHEQPSESKPTVHVVTQGDTYWSLVRRYYPESGDFNAEIERLRDANPDLDERSLSIGTEIVIPPPQPAGGSSGPASPEERGTEAAERLANENSGETGSDADDQGESNRRKSRLSKPMQMPAWAAPSANEQAYDDDKSF